MLVVAFLLVIALTATLALFVANYTPTYSPECMAYNVRVKNSFETPISEIQYQDCSGAVKSLRLAPGETGQITIRAGDDIAREGILTLLSNTAGSVTIVNIEFLGDNRNVFFDAPDCGKILVGREGINLLFTNPFSSSSCRFSLLSVR